MALLKTKEEIEILAEGGRRLASILKKISEEIRPGVSTKELDGLAYRLVREEGDEPAFLNYQPEDAPRPFPSSLCVSINEEIVHGLPYEGKILKEGDIVTIDMGLIHQGLITDSAITVPVGEIDKESKRLLQATEECLSAGIRAVKAGNFVGDIGFAVSEKAKEFGLNIAEDLVGHGVGHEVHEDPLVPNFGRKGEGMKLKAGMVIAIEPMLCLGSGKIFTESDGWTIRTADKKRSAHFEHTVAVTEEGSVVLTSL